MLHDPGTDKASPHRPIRRPGRLPIVIVIVIALSGLLLITGAVLAGGPPRRAVRPRGVWRAFPRPPVPLVPGIPPGRTAQRDTGPDPGIIQPAPAGIDDRFIVEARPDIDEGIIIGRPGAAPTPPSYASPVPIVPGVPVIPGVPAIPGVPVIPVPPPPAPPRP